MSDNVVRREVQRRDDPFGIPACFYWTVDEVADWIESIGYGKYKENFRSHFINGRKLLTIDACVLPKMGITHFGDILGMCKNIRDILGIKKHIRDYNPYHLRQEYMSVNIPCGKRALNINYHKHLNNVEKTCDMRLKFFRKRNFYYSGWTMKENWDEKLKAEETKADKKIGGSMQERLLEASKREITFVEPQPNYTSSLKETHKKLCQGRKPTVKSIKVKNKMNTTVIGHVNWSPIVCPKAGATCGEAKRDKQTDQGKKCTVTISASKNDKNTPEGGDEENNKTGSRKQKKKNEDNSNRLYLPIIFHWKKMEPTRGYPRLKLEQKVACGFHQPDDNNQK